MSEKTISCGGTTITVSPDEPNEEVSIKVFVPGSTERSVTITIKKGADGNLQHSVCEWEEQHRGYY